MPATSPGRPVEILLVEDTPDDADLMIEALKEGTFAPHVTVVEDGEEAMNYLHRHGAYAAALAQYAVDPNAVVPMVGASGAISAVMGAFALSFSRPRMITKSPAANRWINAVWLLAAWIVLQMMMGWLGNSQGYLLATPAHVGGFAAGLLLQRPLLMWRYRSA